MRQSTMALIVAGVLLAGAILALVLFWFAGPRWWPNTVIAYSPSLRQVLRAHVFRIEDSVPFKRPEYSRFEQRYGQGIFAAMAACDDGSDEDLRMAILMYLGEHMHQPAARAIVWRYSDQGHSSARSLIRHHADSIPQGIDAATVIERSQR